MFRFATKTNLELENEETERLVRESPKVKPPRYDRRRERVKSDWDQDIGGDPDVAKDPDLSLNYKTIGGSLSNRVFNRWVKAKAESKAKAKTESKVKVRKKDTGWVGWVSKKTIKEAPAEFEVVKEEEEPSEKVPAKEEKPLEGKPPKGEGKKISDAEANQTLRDMVKEDPEFSSILKDFTNPKSDMFQWAKASPDAPIPEQLMHGRTLPKGIKTMGDLQRVLLYKAPAKKAPVKESGPKEPGAEPEAKPKKPKAPAKKVPKEPERAPGSPDRPYSPEELTAAHNQLIHTFPPETAAKLMMTYPSIHPDEINNIITEYHKARHISPELKDVPGLRDSISAVYATDPNQVPPPKADKNGKPFESLPEDEKVKVHRQYQIETLAMSLAARDAVAKSFENEVNIPEDLSDNLADFILSGHKEDPENRMKRASKKAEELFYEGIKAAPKKPFPDQTIKKVLDALGKDQAAKKVVVGYFQAQDYQDARKRFLDPKSKESISERQSPDKIATRLSKAVDFLRKQTRRYPEDAVVQDTAMTFRTRTMQHLGSLAPEKQPLVQELLDEDDNRYYDEAMDKHKRKITAFIKEHKKEYDAANLAFRREFIKQIHDEHAPPPLETEKRLKSKGIIPPPEPVKPLRYDLQRKKPKELKESAKKLWKFFKRRTASVVARDLVRNRMASQPIFDSFFIYSDPYAMDSMKNRKAVYWGVEPNKVTPYVDWSQPQARDLTDRDFSRVLTAARNWLETPVLSTAIEGVVRDTQLRAALDLALRTENYDHAIHPALYNDLLSRLAREPRDETLVTVRNANQVAIENQRRSKMSDKVELNINKADQILARLDRMASTIQENHEKWGMKFATARDLVNEIDKIADELEVAAYGDKSFTVRQAQILGKTAEVIQRDTDEGYMETFKNPMAPIQTEANEPYMKAYGDDQSSAVNHGKSETGRPLAP
jgi:hypothetical protein